MYQVISLSLVGPGSYDVNEVQIMHKVDPRSSVFKSKVNRSKSASRDERKAEESIVERQNEKKFSIQMVRQISRKGRKKSMKTNPSIPCIYVL